jgi:hypothetical protein
MRSAASGLEWAMKRKTGCDKERRSVLRALAGVPLLPGVLAAAYAATGKTAGLTGGAITNSVTLTTACGTFALIDAGDKAAGKLAKLDADVQSACAQPGIDLAALFDGLPATCHGTAAGLSACLQAHARCRACVALRSSDGALTMDCDVFDDDSANLSCS